MSRQHKRANDRKRKKTALQKICLAAGEGVGRAVAFSVALASNVKVSSFFGSAGSEPPPRRTEDPGNQTALARGQRGQGRAAMPMASFDILLARSQEQVPGWVMIMLRFPPRSDGPVTASILAPDAFHPFQRSQLTSIAPQAT